MPKKMLTCVPRIFQEFKDYIYFIFPVFPRSFKSIFWFLYILSIMNAVPILDTPPQKKNLAG